MAKTKKNTKKTAPPPPVEMKEPGSISRKRQARLGFGIFFLLTGIYICLSIASYCFTWKEDQSQLLSAGRTFHFLFNDDSPIKNTGGRLGAVISHALVYQGAGIAGLAVGIWVALIGIELIYGKRLRILARYLRWVSIILLVIAPVLAFVMPDSDFPYGGAWGNQAIGYMNGFLGQAGTGLVLAAIACFFIFVVFALDIRPFLHRARRTAKGVAAAIKPTAVQVTENDAVNETVVPPFNAPTAEALITVDEETGEVQDWGSMTLAEKEAAQTVSINDVYANEYTPGKKGNQLTEAEEEEEPLNEEEEEAMQEMELTMPVPEEQKKEEDDTQFSFEVINKQEDEAPIVHGAHISIEDREPYAPELDLPSYKFPTLDLLEDRSQETITLDKEELEKNKNQIIQTLKSFSIEIQRISATVGPTVTLYEIVPAEGVRISKIRNLEDDIALNLAALGIRIIAPIPGRGTIGIEVPNANKQIVSMRALLASEKFANSKMSLPIALGKKIDNENYIVDLATMPHLLMAGATGQGKSVGINAILVSLLYKKHPSQVKFVMIDPKKVELSIYRTIEKHFLAKLPNEEEAIITDTKKVIYTLNALCIEMDNRYELLKEAGARNIKEYNEKFINRRLNPERGHKFLPFIVLVIDEFADLIMTAGKEVEMPIARLAQLARAIGIHLIIATQRPSVNVITGTIKANFPGRIAFKVSAKVDSRTILDSGGAEQLIGRGDMLVSHGSELLRLQCAFVDTPEVENVVEFIGKQRGYPSAFELPEYEGEEADADKIVDLTNRDKLFGDCAKTVVSTQSGSTSMLQRRYNLGYNRAGRIMDQLEAAGIVGPAMGSKPRDVLFKTDAELEQFLSALG
jgi:DNA segregation ATPase FtsK/SpoIIIE, S-DNA-T family